MQALHYDNHGAILFAVEPAEQGVEEPVVCRAAPSFRQSVVGFQNVVKDQQVGSAPGEDAANRRRIRNPCAVVMKSFTELLSADSLVRGKVSL